MLSKHEAQTRYVHIPEALREVTAEGILNWLVCKPSRTVVGLAGSEVMGPLAVYLFERCRHWHRFGLTELDADVAEACDEPGYALSEWTISVQAAIAALPTADGLITCEQLEQIVRSVPGSPPRASIVGGWYDWAAFGGFVA